MRTIKQVTVVLTVLLALGGAGGAGAAQAPIDGARSDNLHSAAAGPALEVPKLGIHGAPIIKVGITPRGQLAVGPSVHAVYTWKDGVRPGQPGSAVLAGHTWSRGAGVFDRLGSLRAGDRLSVGRADFEVTRVRRVRQMSRGDVEELFTDRGRARIVLITCGDRSATTGVYGSRILVFADRV